MTIPKILLVVFLIFGPAIALIGYVGYLYPPYVNEKAPSEAVEPQTTLADLLDAIEWVESGDDPDAVGDGGLAVGCMQIHPIMVRDANRILGWDGYTLDDRYDRYKSRQMCRIFLYHYCKDMSFENMARCWNGGPNGWKKESTKPYWEKVKARLEI